MSCRCYESGGPFVDVDPNCEVHRRGGSNDRFSELEHRVATLEHIVESLLERVRNLPSSDNP